MFSFHIAYKHPILSISDLIWSIIDLRFRSLANYNYQFLADQHHSSLARVLKNRVGYSLLFDCIVSNRICFKLHCLRLCICFLILIQTYQKFANILRFAKIIFLHQIIIKHLSSANLFVFKVIKITLDFNSFRFFNSSSQKILGCFTNFVSHLLSWRVD